MYKLWNISPPKSAATRANSSTSGQCNTVKLIVDKASILCMSGSVWLLIVPQKSRIMEKYGEVLAMRQKNSSSLLAGQFSSMCDAMKTHADTNYL